MRAAVVSILTLCLWVSGCGLIMVGQPVEELDLDSQDNAQENLKAIRAMLADQASRAPSAVKHPDGSSRLLLPQEINPVSDPHAAGNALTPSSSSPAPSGRRTG